MARKILVIRFSSIGDIVLTTPVVRVLREQTGAEVHFLTKPAFAPLLQANPYITRVITLTEHFDQFIEQLSDQHYDLIIDLHHNIRSHRIKMALRRPAKTFHKLNFQKWLLVRFGINRLPDIHIVDRYLATTADLGVKSDGKGLDLFIPEEFTVNARDELGLAPNAFIALVTGAAHQTKCMTSAQMIRLCHLLNKPIILLGGKSEMEKAEEIMRGTETLDIVNACGKFNLLQSASIVSQSAVVITPDTGLMHIAAALHKPLVVVWGNTVPEFGMYPYYGHEQIPWKSFSQDGLKCRPCSKLGYQQCPKGHFRCMLDHDLSAIAEAAIQLFNGDS